MKVALCISGQPRSVIETFPYIKEHILDVNNPDVFVHSWIDAEAKGKRYVAACGDSASFPIPDNVPEVISDLYKPTVAKYQPQIQFDELNYATNKFMFIRPANTLSQNYSKQQVFQLLKLYGKEYDAVIRMRFDWAIQTPIDASTVDLNAITMPNDCPHHRGYNDQFAIGNSTNMQIYGHLYDAMPDLFNVQNVPFCDEVLLFQHLENNNVPVNLIQIGYFLNRGPQDGKHVENIV